VFIGYFSLEVAMSRMISGEEKVRDIRIAENLKGDSKEAG